MLQVVTGASGFIGNVLVRHLLEQGATVRALTRHPGPSLESVAVEQAWADVADPGSLRTAFAGADTVYHLASIIPHRAIGARDMRLLNVDGVRNVLAACQDCGVRRLVYVGTVNAFAPHPRQEPVTEERPLIPAEDSRRVPPYSHSKSMAQQLVLASASSGLEVVVVCPAAVIGPMDFGPSPLGRLVLDLSAGRMPILINGGCNLVDVRDLVAGIGAAGRHGQNGATYLLGGEDVALARLADLVAKTAAKPSTRPVLPMTLAYLGLPFVALAGRLSGGEPMYSADTLWPLRFHRQISSQKARQDLGYTSRPIAETIHDTVIWLQQHFGSET